MEAKTDTRSWLEKYKAAFLPPVCNKMLHGEGQLKVFYVGGPNVRKDFHLEEGEEVFFQRQGAINVVTVQNGKINDVLIKEGEIFLLPGKIPHSPQRYENTMGLVIERDRIPEQEFDCLRYYCNESLQVLWERWFYCTDLGSQLGPVIREFFASEQYRTGRPGLDSCLCQPYFEPDHRRKSEAPFALRGWLTRHAAELDQEGSRRLFDESYQTDVLALGRGTHADCNPRAETFLWQTDGVAELTVGGERLRLEADQTLLVPAGVAFSSCRPEAAVTISITMDPANKQRAFAATQ